MKKSLSNYVQSGNSHLHRFGIVLVTSLCLLLALLLGACNSESSASMSANTQTSNTTISAPTPATTSPLLTQQDANIQDAKSYPVKIYFSKTPQSKNDFTAVFPVNRVSPTSATATFAMQQLIAGPTASEQRAGYFTDLHNALQGISTCAGQDFTLALNKKGLSNVQGTATLQFCRGLSSAGIGTDARIQSEITATLTQFATIKKVIILTNAGHCFGDGSGLDKCLY